MQSMLEATCRHAGQEQPQLNHLSLAMTAATDTRSRHGGVIARGAVTGRQIFSVSSSHLLCR